MTGRMVTGMTPLSYLVPLTVLIVFSVATETPSDGSTLLEEGKILLEEFYSRYNATKQVDLVFVLDRSGSVPLAGWHSMLEFIGKILEHFTVDKDNTRVAVITFSTTASVDINDLDQGNRTHSETKCTLYSRLRDRVESRIPFGYTATNEALRKAYRVLIDSRPNAKKAVLILTDGKSNIGPPPVRTSFDILSLRWNLTWNRDALGPQVEVYAFGIENAYVPELRSIASSLPNHVFMIPRFSLFADFARSLHGGLQEENWVPTENDHCTPSCNSTFAQCMCGSRVGVYACACSRGYEMIGDVCTACPIGYYKDNAKPEKCSHCPENTTTDNTASVSLEECHPLAGHQVCEPLPDIANGRKFQVTGTRKDEILNTGIPCDRVKDGNSCHYECDIGYRLSGPPVMICNNSGLWEGEIPTCDAVDCYEVESTFGVIPGADIRYTDNRTIYGATAEVTCHPGRVPLPDVTSWSCDQHGQWKVPSGFQCAEVFCPPVHLSQFMTVTPTECATDLQPHGNICTLSCAEGFKLIGEASKVCSFTDRATWKREDWPVCKDIQNPTIMCPDNITLLLPYFKQNSTRLHRSVYDNPVINDNSWPPGVTNYTIEDLPPDGVFHVGVTFLRYVATDSEGNVAKCTQSIHVIEKKVDIQKCPSDIHMIGRSMEVTWEDPEFIGLDGELLSHVCTPPSGSMFTGEGNIVSCYHESFPEAKCVFNVTVKPKTCPKPDDPPPERGALACGKNNFLQEVCRVMCQKGYSMKDLSKQEYRCLDDGTWTPELGNWPMCSKTGWGRNVLIVQSMHIRYSGNCAENTETIREAFEATMRHILTTEFGPCVEEHLCSVQDVSVMCGATRRKRGTSYKLDPWLSRRRTESRAETRNDGNDKDDKDNSTESRRQKRSVDGITIEFALWVECDDTKEASLEEQRRLLSTLEDATYSISDMVQAGNFSLDIGGERHLAEFVEMVNDIPDFRLNCSDDEVPVINTDNVDELSARCVVCGPGSYLDNGDCILCPNNTYQDKEGQRQCKQCPDNKITLAPGSWNITQCKDTCTPGSYSSTGYEPCTLCDKGQYQTDPGQTSCKQCPQNTTTEAPGTSDVTMCKALCDSGTYSKTGLEPCAVCPPGTYQPDPGMTSCLACDYLQPTAEMEEWCLEPMNCSLSNTSCLHGFCVMSHNNLVICKCNDGFHGDACELNIDDCTEDSCRNGGICHDVINGFTCECPPAYSGVNCEHYVGYCSVMPCHNNASCVNNGTGFYCICAEGYNGTTCEEAVDPCISSPCLHGSCTAENGEISCNCDMGYGGAYCQKSIDNCANITCHNGGTCRSTEASFRCTCTAGSTGEFCEKSVDYCTPEPCHGNGRCVNTLTAYYCICSEGFYGSQCTLNADPDFALSFKSTKFGFVELPVWEVMYNISVCLWMRSLDITRYGTLLSYGATSNWVTTSFSDVFTLYDYSNLQVIVNGEAVDTHMKFNDGFWHHICVTWNGDAGKMRIYVNGTISGSALVARGTHLEAPGNLVIGQRQLGELEQYFVMKNGYVGDMSQLNVYSRVLEENVIMSLANMSYCTPGHGDVLAWTSVLQGVRGDIGISAQCLDVNECLSPHICEDYEYCVDKTEGYECRPCPSAGCPSTPKPEYDYCSSSPCLNGGTCDKQINRCVCPLGYTGNTCQLLVSTCSILTCHNGGTCHEVSGGVYCKCKPPWRGQYCHVLYDARCDERPCLNGGTCHEQIATGEYTCTCPSDGREYGFNCEIITPCDRTPSPCISGATCLVLDDGADDANITCLCPPEYEGETCFYTPPVTMPTTPTDYCGTVQCQHGGLCTNLANGFQCDCPIEYTGLYCEKERGKKTRRYDVSVSLDMEYKPSMKQNEVFKENIKQQVHNIYASSLKQSTLRVEIVDIRPGSILVDMIFYHTVYENTAAPDPKHMEVILYNNLQNNKFGTLPASTNNFKFNYKGAISGWVIYLLVCVAIFTLIVVILVTWYVISKRKQRSQPLKLNNMPMCDLNRVVNPAFEADSNPATPQMRHVYEEELYSDLDPSPYAVDLCSGGKDSDPKLNKRFPSKRGRDINKDWASWQRKAIPLPPKPGEAATATTDPGHGRDDEGYLAPCKGTPPPSYKDVNNKDAVQKYGRQNINIESEYIAPMSAYEEKYGDDTGEYLKPAEAAKDNNIAKAKDLHVYINEPRKGRTVNEQEGQTQPTYLPLLPTPPVASETGDRKGDGENDDVKSGESPDYLRLNQPADDVSKEAGASAADGRTTPEVDPDERDDRKQESGSEKSEVRRADGEVSAGGKNHVTVYAIGGNSNDEADD